MSARRRVAWAAWIAAGSIFSAIAMAHLRSGASAQSSMERDLAPSAAEIQRALARYAHEPTVHAVVRAALAASAVSPAQASALASRARLSGLLPRLKLGARRGQAWDVTTPGSTTTTPTRLSTDDDLVLDASVTLDLSRLLFAREEVGLMREARQRNAVRQKLTETVIALYFERRRLQLERGFAAPSVAREARIAELSALLNSFTDGAFQRMMGSGSQDR